MDTSTDAASVVEPAAPADQSQGPPPESCSSPKGGPPLLIDATHIDDIVEVELAKEEEDAGDEWQHYRKCLKRVLEILEGEDPEFLATIGRALGLAEGCRHKTILMALGEVEHPEHVLFANGLDRAKAAEVTDILDDALNSYGEPLRGLQFVTFVFRRARQGWRNTLASVFLFLSIVSLSVGLFLDSAERSSGWATGVCNVRRFSSSSCDKGLDECKMDVFVQTSDGERTMPRWTPEVSSNYGSVTILGDPFRCCSSVGVFDCCSFFDYDFSLFCDAWPHRSDSNGDACPTGDWDCSYMLEGAPDGEVAALRLPDPSFVLPFLISGAVCFALTILLKGKTIGMFVWGILSHSPIILRSLHTAAVFVHSTALAAEQKFYVLIGLGDYDGEEDEAGASSQDVSPPESREHLEPEYLEQGDTPDDVGELNAETGFLSEQTWSQPVVHDPIYLRPIITPLTGEQIRWPLPKSLREKPGMSDWVSPRGSPRSIGHSPTPLSPASTWGWASGANWIVQVEPGREPRHEDALNAKAFDAPAPCEQPRPPWLDGHARGGHSLRHSACALDVEADFASEVDLRRELESELNPPPLLPGVVPASSSRRTSAFASAAARGAITNHGGFGAASPSPSRRSSVARATNRSLHQPALSNLPSARGSAAATHPKRASQHAA